MSEIVPLLLLIPIFLLGLMLIPLGLPGLWLMVLALIGYAAFTGFERVGWVTLAVVVVMALLAEGAEAWLGFKFARRTGASTRAGWGALLGGLVGAVVGTPVPIIGNVIGAFVGAFVGAVVFEQTRGTDIREALGAGWGAVLGRAAGATVKIAVGFAIAVIGIYSALG
jgi:uncharacterized protein YqgC (DUF456 family)